jgi:heme/copper-type cytochrome/quinol oxidase subunit 2
LIYDPNSALPIPCSLKCPVFEAIPRYRYEPMIAICTFIAWISLACIAFVIVSYAIRKEKRKWPSNIVIFMAAAQVVLVSAIAIYLFVPYYYIVCDDDDLVATFGWPPCVLQGKSTVYS